MSTIGLGKFTVAILILGEGNNIDTDLTQDIEERSCRNEGSSLTQIKTTFLCSQQKKNCCSVLNFAFDTSLQKKYV